MVWWLVIVRLLRRYLQFGLVEVGERVKPKVRSRLKTSCKSIGLQNWSSACNGLVTFHYFDISSLHDIVYYHFNNQSTGTSCIFDGQHVSLLIVFWTSQLKRVLPHNNCITVSNHIYIYIISYNSPGPLDNHPQWWDRNPQEFLIHQPGRR